MSKTGWSIVVVIIVLVIAFFALRGDDAVPGDSVGSDTVGSEVEDLLSGSGDATGEDATGGADDAAALEKGT